METLIFNANMVNIRQLFGPEELPGRSRNGPQAGSVSELLGVFFSRDCDTMFCCVMLCNLQLFSVNCNQLQIHV